MQNKLLSSLLAVALAGTIALPVAAQNLAIVNGKAIPTARAELLQHQLEQAGQKLTPEVKNQIKEEVITREIFMQEAQKRGLQNSQNFKDQLELARQALLIRELFADQQKKNPITDADLQAEYDKFAAANSGKEYKASHILVDSEEQAKSIIAQLNKGANFEEIAKKESKDPGSGAKGGDLGWASPSSYVAEFTEAMIKLEKGKTTQEPVKSQFGWHIIRLDDLRDAQLPKFAEVKDQIRQQLEQQKLMQFQQDVRAKAKVE